MFLCLLRLTFLNLNFRVKIWKFLILCLIWIGLLSLNLKGLISYTWTWRMYPLCSLYFAMVAWRVVCLRRTLYMRRLWSYRRWSHYLPLRRPIWLWAFLPLIEVISQLIRPVTLTLRLRANLIAGHSILFLIGCLPWLRLSNSGFLVFVPFEIIVAIVQRVVFSLLLQTYNLER